MPTNTKNSYSGNQNCIVKFFKSVVSPLAPPWRQASTCLMQLMLGSCKGHCGWMELAAAVVAFVDAGVEGPPVVLAA